MLFKYGKRRALWNLYDLYRTRLFKIIAICKWILFDCRLMKKELKEYNINKVKPYNFQGWHEGTCTFCGQINGENRVFIKRSKYERAIQSEIESIQYITENCRKDILSTCDIICSGKIGRYSYVVENFIEGVALSEDLSILDEKIIEKLRCIIEEFQRIGFFHCDFTPKNIFVDKKDGITIIDYEYSYHKGNDLYGTRLKQLNSRKIKGLGGDYALGNGVLDDSFSLVQIIKLHCNQYIINHRKEWRSLNYNIGRHCIDMNTINVLY